MANTLRAKLSKLRHDGNITDAEYKKLIKRIYGYDIEMRDKTIDECIKVIEETVWRDTDMLVENIRKFVGGVKL